MQAAASSADSAPHCPTPPKPRAPATSRDSLAAQAAFSGRRNVGAADEVAFRKIEIVRVEK